MVLAHEEELIAEKVNGGEVADDTDGESKEEECEWATESGTLSRDELDPLTDLRAPGSTSRFRSTEEVASPPSSPLETPSSSSILSHAAAAGLSKQEVFEVEEALQDDRVRAKTAMLQTPESMDQSTVLARKLLKSVV